MSLWQCSPESNRAGNHLPESLQDLRKREENPVLLGREECSHSLAHPAPSAQESSQGNPGFLEAALKRKARVAGWARETRQQHLEKLLVINLFPLHSEDFCSGMSGKLDVTGSGSTQTSSPILSSCLEARTHFPDHI